MADYNRYRGGRSRQEEDANENYYRRSNYGDSDYGNSRQDSYDKSSSRDMTRGYSSYGAEEENPYRGESSRYDRPYGGQYQGNFSGSDYDRDYDFGINRRGMGAGYGQYGNPDYGNYDRRQDWRNNPANLGVGSNYAYNRGGYGSTYGGEYGHFGHKQDLGGDYAGEYGGASYSHTRGRRDPNREYSSYSGRYDRDYEQSWKRDNRDWMDRAKDEVASWFGDDDAERRRRLDKRDGEHRGRGPKGYRRSDSRIEEDINDRLSEDGWVDASDVEVKVENGEVMLTGAVPDRFSKRRAEDIAESVSGVMNVENRIRVTQQNLPQAASYRDTQQQSGSGNATGNTTDGRARTRQHHN